LPADTIITAPVQKSRFTIATFYDRVRGNCALRGSNRVTDADILEALNEACDEIAQETHWYRTSSSINATDGVKEYDLPAGILTVEEVWWNPLSRRLFPVSPPELEDLYGSTPNWRYASEGTPTHYYVQVNSALGVHPTPDATTANAIFVVWTGLPPRADSSDDFLFHPAGHERTVINYACWKASLKDATGEGAKRLDHFRAAYVEGLSKCKRQVEALFEEGMTVYGEYGTGRGGRGFPRTDWMDGSAIPAPS
jgi:hypothetical protein